MIGIRDSGFGIRFRPGLVGAACIVALSTCADAQPTARRATNIAALLAYPGFYNTRQVVIVGSVALSKENRLQISDEAGAISLVFKGNAPDGRDEVRGEFWDIGRMKADDPRLTSYDLRTVFHVDPEAPWPRPGEVMAIMASAVTPASPVTAPTIRSIVLNPGRYREEKVTITGQYSGRNLLGDLPDAPARSRYDFVLRSADAAIWVSNMRPKMKDAGGKEIEFALDSRLDTSRWVTVRGTLQHGRGLQWLEAEAGSLALAKPPSETTADEEPIRVPAAPPPSVVFSAPTDEETDVVQSTNVRIQFSRDLDQATLKGHIQARYLESQTVERGEPTTPKADFTFQYNPSNRVLVLTFTSPLERFRTVKVELLEGILGTDAQPLKPWTLTFAVGGS